MQRSLVTVNAAQSAMELVLVDRRQEVPCVWRIAGHVILRAGVKILLRPLDRWSNALILRAQLPPALVVVLRLDLTGEDLPAPLINEIPERQEGDLRERAIHQDAHVLALVGHVLDQAELLQIFGRDGERDGVTDR